MNIAEQAAQVLAEIDVELAICEKATAGPWDAGAESGMAFLSARDRCIPGVSDIGLYTDDTTTGEGLRNLGFIASARTVCPTALRMLKTAIEGLKWLSLHPENVIGNSTLTTLITQWNSK